MAINPQNAATLRSSLPVGRMYYTAPTITLRGPIVVVQHPAQTLAAQHRSASISWRAFRQDQPVGQSLVVPFVMIMQHEFLKPFAQPCFAKPVAEDGGMARVREAHGEAAILQRLQHPIPPHVKRGLRAIERLVNQHRAGEDIGARETSPVAAVERIVAIVSQHEVFAAPLTTWFASRFWCKPVVIGR